MRGAFSVPFALSLALLVSLACSRPEARVYPDTTTYASLASQPMSLAGVLSGRRPPVFPMILRLCGADLHALLFLQAIAAAVAWTVLGCAVSRLLPNPRAALAAQWLFPALGCTAPVAWWNLQALTESTSLTLAALTEAVLAYVLLLWPARARAPSSPLLQCACTLFLAAIPLAFAYTRDTNACVLPILAFVFLAAGHALRRETSFSVHLRAIGVFLLVAFIGACSGTLRPGRARGPILDIYCARILPDAPRRDLFVRDFDMPVPTKFTSVLDDGYYPSQNGWARENPKFLDWCLTRGEASYWLYLAGHLPSAILETCRGSWALNPWWGCYAAGGRAIEAARKLWSLLFFPIPLPLLALLLLASLPLWMARARKCGPAIALFVSISAGFAYLHFFLSYHGEAFELMRHSVAGTVTLRIAAISFVLLLVPAPAPRPAAEIGSAGAEDCCLTTAKSDG